MKKRLAIIVLVAILTIALFVVCSCENPVEPSVVEVSANSERVSVKDTDVTEYDYTQLFTIVKDQVNVTVEKSFLDLSAVSATQKSFTVTCTYEGKSATVTVNVTATVYSVTAIKSEVTVEDVLVDDYDFKSLFAVRVDGVRISVTDDMISTDLTNQAGTYNYTVTCGTASATMVVNVVTITRTVELAQSEIVLNQNLVADYDFNALFTVKTNGKKISVTSDMVTSDVCSDVGTYTYTVTHGNSAATLTVVVTDSHEVLIVPSYKELSLTLAQLQNFNYTTLFSLYVDGVAVQVTEEMLDISALSEATVGESYLVVMNYADEKTSHSASVTISVVEESEICVSTKQLVTYPNSEYIELTSLFEITKGSEIISVTNEMVSGTIDYSKEGVNEITLTYDGNTYVSTVEVKRGVIINYAKGDVVTIKCGTDKNAYLFAEDFIVYVNGLRFRDIAQYVDSSQADFNTKGEYEVTLSVPYNEKSVGLSGAKLVYVTKTITYKVVDYEYQLSVKNDDVVLSKGTTSYNVFSNLTLTRNNVSNQVGNQQDWINAVYCYAEVVSQPLDFSAVGKQLVEIDVYVGCFKVGDDLGEAVRISYFVEIKNDVSIVAKNFTTFGNETIYTTDLFTVFDGNQQIEVTTDMVSGKVDTFNAGIYTVTCQYLGASATATVVVINPNLAGIYKTGQTTIATIEEEDEDYSEGYWEEEGGSYYSLSTASLLGDMIISPDGEITVNGKKGEFLEGIDENTLLIKIGSYEYKLYSYDGIVVLDPDNSIKLAFNENKRPLVYFNTNQWTLQDAITINYGSNHVLSSTAIGYSYDVFNVLSRDGREMWYGLKIHLVNKTSADTIYQVSWGEVTFGESFVPQTGVVSTITMDDNTESFTMQSSTLGRINEATSSNEWNGKVFEGTVDGKYAVLSVVSASTITYSVEGKKIIGTSAYDLTNNMKNGGCNFADNTILLYNFNEKENGGICSYKFSVDPQNNTFELLPQDGIFGKYVSADGSKWLFLDGYGMGIFKFDASGGYQTQFTYTLLNQELDVRFFNTNATFTYGTHVTFNLADLKNVLTTKYSFDNLLKDIVFTNIVITDGAVVNFITSKVCSGTTCKQDIVNGIQIITKDGELTYEQKTAKVGGVAVVDTSAVGINQAGIYQIAINISVDGKTVKSYYAVQVVTEIYKGSELTGAFGSGVVNNSISFLLDTYGNIILSASGTEYKGYAIIDQANQTFVGKAFANDGSAVVLNGYLFSTGVVLVRSTGAVSFSDYFSVGEKSVAGCDNGILRKITANGVSTYIWSVSADSLGEMVSVEVGEDDVYLITKADGTTFVAKIVWGTNAKSGLTVADRFRGTYVGDGDDLVVDGFGNAWYGSQKGSYVAVGNTLTVTTDTALYAFKLNITDSSYQQMEVDIAKLIENRTFTANYNFTEDSSIYTATTSLTFYGNGSVVITSVCSDYEENGVYNPVFASKEGLNGTFTINNNKIIIKINGQTFAYRVGDVVECSRIICESTTLASDSVGYFATDTVFSA